MIVAMQHYGLLLRGTLVLRRVTSVLLLRGTLLFGPLAL